MHTIKDTPYVVNGEIKIRPIMVSLFYFLHIPQGPRAHRNQVLALSYDHKILDGREAVTLLVLIKKYIEDPASMLLASPV